MVTEFGTNSAQNVLRWSKKLYRESIGKTLIRKLMSGGKNAAICLLSELEKNAGDTVKYDLLMQMTGAGVDGDTRLQGFEEALVYRQDELKIDQKRNGHSFRTMTQQRTLHDLRRDAKDNLADWFAVKFDRYALSYLAGTAGDVAGNVAAELPFAGNALEAPDAEHLYVPNATMDLNFIDHLVEKAKTLDPLIRPCMIDGERMYVLILHPYSVTELVTKAGDTQWRMIQARVGQRGRRNPIFTGALGIHNNVVIHESEYIPRSEVPVTKLTHNLFLGAQAGTIAFGQAYNSLGRQTEGKGEHFNWFEDVDDFGNETGVAAGSVFGIKKARFNGADFGVIRLDTEDVAHT